MNQVFYTILSQIVTALPFGLVYVLLNIYEKHRAEVPSDTIAKNKQVGSIRFAMFAIIISLYLFAFGLGLYIQETGLIPDVTGTFPPISGISIWVPSAIALLFFVPTVRKILSKWTPIDPHNSIHTITLAISMVVFIQLFFSMSIGLESLTQGVPSPSTTQAIVDIWTQDLLIALFALLGVGWLTRRNLRETLKRLGITVPTWKTLAIGVIIGISFVFFSVFVEAITIQTNFLYDPEVDKITQKLIGPLLDSVWGILSLGLAAALGEELMFRGALLPRLGVLYTSILFTFVHVNYGFSMATIIVFILALLLAYLRIQYGTTMTITVHATYNIVLGFFTVLS